jgi:hypothetical protein
VPDRSSGITQLGTNIMNNAVRELADTEIDRVCGGNEMDMIRLQSLVATRQMIMQMTTNMLRALGEATGAVVKNIR